MPHIIYHFQSIYHYYGNETLHSSRIKKSTGYRKLSLAYMTFTPRTQTTTYITCTFYLNSK